MLYVEQRALHT